MNGFQYESTRYKPKFHGYTPCPICNFAMGNYWIGKQAHMKKHIKNKDCTKKEGYTLLLEMAPEDVKKSLQRYVGSLDGKSAEKQGPSGGNVGKTATYGQGLHDTGRHKCRCESGGCDSHGRTGDGIRSRGEEHSQHQCGCIPQTSDSPGRPDELDADV